MAGGFVARLAVGPAALAAFFLPWVGGRGALASADFSGFELVAFSGALGALHLAPFETIALVVLRISLLAIAVAAAWQTILVALVRSHPLYAMSGWYLAAAAAGALLVSATLGYRPHAGLLLLLASGALFAACEIDLQARGLRRAAAHLRPGTAPR